MTKVHIVENGVVTNTIVATHEEAQAAFPAATILDASEHAGAVGYVWDGTALSKPVVTLSLSDKQSALQTQLTAHYQTILADPHCDTGLGFEVNAGYENLTDFREGLTKGWLRVRDYANQYHDVSESEMAQIIDKIVAYGFAVKARKWALEDEIKNATDASIDSIDVASGWPV